MKQIIKLSVFLCVVAALSAAAMTLVYSRTEPVIEAASLAKEKAQLASIYDKDDTFTKVTKNLSKYEDLETCYKVSKNGKTEGYVYKVSIAGYGGDIVYLIGLDESGIYKGYETIDVSTETSGFGSRVATSEMKDKIVGKKIGAKIDTLSGATISSSAVVNGITEATNHYNKTFKEAS